MLVANHQQTLGIVLGPQKSNFATRISYQISKKEFLISTVFSTGEHSIVWLNIPMFYTLKSDWRMLDLK